MISNEFGTPYGRSDHREWKPRPGKKQSYRNVITYTDIPNKIVTDNKSIFSRKNLKKTVQMKSYETI